MSGTKALTEEEVAALLKEGRHLRADLERRIAGKPAEIRTGLIDPDARIYDELTAVGSRLDRLEDALLALDQARLSESVLYGDARDYRLAVDLFTAFADAVRAERAAR